MNSMISIPFQPIAWALRQLSMSGSLGNVVAICIYLVLCISPILFLLYRYRNKNTSYADLLLPLLSFTLFGGIYLMINPRYISNFFGDMPDIEGTTLIISSTIWSILICYITLRLVHNIEQRKTVDVLSVLHILLIIIFFLTVIQIVGYFLFGLRSSIQTVQDGNTNNFVPDELYDDLFDLNSIGALNSVQITVLWLVIRYILRTIPSCLILWMIHLALKAIQALQMDPFSDASLQLSKKLGLESRKMIIITSLIILVTNLLELCLARFLLSMNVEINFPYYAILFMLLILLFSRKIAENQELKSDNDSFI